MLPALPALPRRPRSASSTAAPTSALAAIWLAATSARGAKKLSRKQLQLVDVKAACAAIGGDKAAAPAAVVPEEEAAVVVPPPLRVTATLLVGVARVYGAQCNVSLHDTTTVVQQLRYLFGSHKRTADQLQLDLPQATRVAETAAAGAEGGGAEQIVSRLDAITLHEDPYALDLDLLQLAAGPAEADLLSLAFARVQPPESPYAPAAETELARLYAAEAGDVSVEAARAAAVGTPLGYASALGGMPGILPPGGRRTPLSEPRAGDETLMLPSPPPAGVEPPLTPLGAEEVPLAPFDDVGLDLGLDLGEPFPELPAAAAGVGGYFAGSTSPSAAATSDAFPFGPVARAGAAPMPGLPEELEVEPEPLPPGLLLQLGADARDASVAYDMPLFVLEEAARLEPLPTVPVAAAAAEGKAGGEGQPLRKRARAHAPLVDRGDLVLPLAAYAAPPVPPAHAGGVRVTPAGAALEARHVARFVLAVDDVAEGVEMLAQRVAEQVAQTVTSPVALDADILPEMPEFAFAYPPLAGLTSTSAAGDEYGFPGTAAGPEIESRRAAAAGAEYLPALTELPEDVLADYYAAGASGLEFEPEAGQVPAELPWSTAAGRGPSRAGSAGRISGAGTPAMRDAGFPGGVSPIDGPSPLHAGEEAPLLFGEEPTLPEISTSQLGAALDRESEHFFAYAKGLMQDAATDTLAFAELVEPAGGTRVAAAQALFHVLVLATRGDMRVHQAEAYGEIYVVQQAARA